MNKISFKYIDGVPRPVWWDPFTNKWIVCSHRAIDAQRGGSPGYAHWQELLAKGYEVEAMSNG